MHALVQLVMAAGIFLVLTLLARIMTTLRCSVSTSGMLVLEY